MGHGFRFTSFGSRVIGSAQQVAVRTAFVIADVAVDAVIVITARPLRSGRSRHNGCAGDLFRIGELPDGQMAPLDERLALHPVPLVSGLGLAGLSEPDADRTAGAITNIGVATFQPPQQACGEVDVGLSKLGMLDAVSGCHVRHSHHLLEVDVRATGGGSTIYYTTLRVICKFD